MLSNKIMPVVLLLVIGCAPAFAQENIRQQLFSDADAALAQAKERQANLLAPENFRKAMESYSRAEDDLKRGRNLENIRKSLKEAEVYFKKAVEAAKLSEVTLSSATSARNDAISAGAPRFSQDIWTRAELKFGEATIEVERGDVNDAKKRGADAEALYRQAELEAIKANFLTPAWSLLDKADRMKVDRRAPQTLARARDLAKKAEDLLRQNRYDNDEARQLAQEAKYEAAHAIYLSDVIDKFEQKGLGIEDAVLLAEKPIQTIADPLEIVPRFDKGFDAPTQEVVSKIKDLQDKLRLALDVIDKRNSEITALQQQVGSMEQRLGTLSETEKALKEKVARQREQEEVMTQVSQTFSRDEAQVLRDGNNIIVRLYGLSFPIGKSVIEAQFFGLLTKVQDALRKFPDCSVIIEGHTDSQGSDETNQLLSEDRAAAVRQYLIANMGLPDSHIISVGYGESRPVASNETSDGRAKNRRIDIVIIPAWAKQGGQN